MSNTLNPWYWEAWTLGRMSEQRLWDWRVAMLDIVRMDDTCAGFCNHATKTIELSTQQSDADLWDSALHEIAHAIVGAANPYDAHDVAWLRCFEQLKQRYQ